MNVNLTPMSQHRLAVLEHDGWHPCGILVRRGFEHAVLTEFGRFIPVEVDAKSDETIFDKHGTVP